MKKYVLFNPYANNGKGEADAKRLETVCAGEELVWQDVTKIDDYAAFFKGIAETDEIVICGGDGTLNRFINATAGLALPCKVLYFACGSGNDFLRDAEKSADAPFAFDEYMRELPVVTVNGKEYYFLNGVGYGIDGYCCEVGDALRGKSDKPINYTGIAIKGLLFHYKPTGATVTVDGKEYRFEKVWLAPTMFGRYYGGGMLPAPKQSRNDGEKKLSVMLFHGSGKLKTLMIFPSIFKGGHVKHEKYVTVLSGHNITVKYDEPRALQIDGETILGVTEYSAKSTGAIEKENAEKSAV